jgi:hypothetical protein
VAIDGRAVLITGPSGSGKSGLALHLIALGARLVADDGVILRREGERLLARAPQAIRGLIEVRFVGLLKAEPLDEVPVALVVDLGTTESERLPPWRTTTIEGVALPASSQGREPSFRCGGPAISRAWPERMIMSHPTEGPQPMPQRLVLVTGPAGAGRGTAIKALEDMGFETIDNLPLSLLPRLLDGPPISRPIALGIDPRNRDFTTDAFLDLVRGLASRPEINAEMLYLDAREEVLLRRFSETRRRHPLAPDESPEIGIAREARCSGRSARAPTRWWTHRN